MADQAVPKAETYVYILYREDGTPFYVGIGTGKRWLIHERDAHRGDSRKDRIILKMRAAGITEVPKLKVAQNLTREQAASMEVALIAQIGRAPRGPLVNHTAGGDGAADLSAEAQAKKGARNRVTWADPEVRKKRSEGMRAVWTPEKRAAQAAEARARMADPAYRKRVSEARKKAVAATPVKPHSPERKKAQSEWFKARWLDPIFRQAMTAKASGRKHSEETKTKIGVSSHTPQNTEKRIAGIKEKWADPDYRALGIAALKERNNRPETIEKIRAASAGRRHSPETKAKMRATALAMGNWVGRKHSPEAKAKMSATRKAKAAAKH